MERLLDNLNCTVFVEWSDSRSPSFRELKDCGRREKVQSLPEVSWL